MTSLEMSDGDLFSKGKVSQSNDKAKARKVLLLYLKIEHMFLVDRYCESIYLIPSQSIDDSKWKYGVLSPLSFKSFTIQ